MNFGDFLVKLGHILGILSGDGSTTTTGITTVGIGSTKLTTPVIFDRTTLEKLNTEYRASVSPKFLSTLVSGPTTDEVSKVSTVEDQTFTGITAESEVILTTKHQGKTTENTVTGSGSTAAGKTVTGTTGVTETDTTGKTGTATSEENTSPSAKVETTATGQTGSGVTETGQTGSHTTGTGQTGSGATATGQTGSEATATGSDSTDAPPTDKPSLSRGAVAGIVIGCLLLIAVIAAAVVFFVKNRNMPPEAQRLRV